MQGEKSFTKITYHTAKIFLEISGNKLKSLKVAQVKDEMDDDEDDDCEGVCDVAW